MFGLGTTEILFISLLALIFFKAEDLPKVARSVGRFMNELRRGSESFQSQLFEADKLGEKLNEPLDHPILKDLEKITDLGKKTSDSRTVNAKGLGASPAPAATKSPSDGQGES